MKIFSPLWPILLTALALSGCVVAGPRSLDPTAPEERLVSAPAPWGPLATSLAARGLPADKLAAFFRSPELAFNPTPMETKLRELFGIFFRSDLTKAVQEKLYQLGYEVLIDGRLGSGTKNAVKAYQADRGLPRDGLVTDELDRQLTAALKTERRRNLADYRPPPAVKPSRSTTYKQFTNPTALRDIEAFYQADKSLFDRLESVYRVPGPLAASIMWIETGYGRFFGKARAAFSLASMAAAADYALIAPRLADLDVDRQARTYLSETAAQRGAWARDELAALLRYAWDNGLDPASFPGSVYGAIGWGQFMPSNIAKFAVDGDGDGRIDLFNKADAAFSIGRYLRDSGWRGDMADEEKRRAVIMLYNRSGVYVNTVLYVAEVLSR
jgi:membrane-bound lytic murein transglycosylase B